MSQVSLSSSESQSVNYGDPRPLYTTEGTAFTDAGSRLSVTTSGGRSLKLSRTETQKSLSELGVTRSIPVPDVVNPPVEDQIFPEEYTLETPTGLVRAETLHSIGRTKSRAATIANSNLSTPDEKEEIDELDPDLEFVTFLVNDPENPQNWNPILKWFYTFLFSLLVICAAYGSSCLAGGLPTITEQFHVGDEVAILSVSLMVLGFAVGPLLWAPLSEQIGRRPVYFISFGLYTIFNIPVALAPNITAVLICRFLCGVFSASALSNVGASLVDMHTNTRGLAIAFFSFCPYSGPVFGGVVNGFISVGTGRFDLMIWVNMAFAGVMWIVISLIPETYAPVILKRRAKKLRKETGNPKIMTEQEASPMSFSELVNTCLYRPLRFVVSEPVLVLVCGFVCLIYSLLYAFFFAYPVIFNELYGYEDNIIGLMFIPILIGAAMALFTTPLLEKQFQLLCKRRHPVPEDRLIGAMIGAPFPCIALFILGATSYKHIIWVGPASSGIAFGYGMVLIYYSLNNYIIDTYAKYAASALATKVFLRSAGGAAFPLFTTQMYHRLGLQWASWLLAFISLAMVLIPFTFYKYGRQLRAKLCKEDYTAYVLEE
ncbi:Major facilitator superfamily (MFS) profile domain-containing protein [[Candida] zeylanoides]